MSVVVKDGIGTSKYFGTMGDGSATGTPFYSIPADFYGEVAKGNVTGHSIIHKFGQNDAVGTTFVPICRGGVYNTVQAASATTIRVKAGGSANDTAAGSGAREITIEGIDETGAVVSEAVATAGASASSATTATFMRVYRFYVSASGTYATTGAGSHAADIVIENGAGGTDWGTIEFTGFPRSQSEIGAYTIPTGYTGYLLGAYGFVDSTKTTELIFFKRTGILDAAAPYDAMRVVFEEKAESGEFTIDIKAPILLGGACDVGFLAKVDSTTATVEVDFEILLVQD